jgi:hypothetical protein
MGADFVFAVATFKNWDKGYDEEIQLNERKERLIRLIAEATPTQLEEYFDNRGTTGDDELDKKLTILEKRKVIIKVIMDFFECLTSREVGSFLHEDCKFYLAGGMSYGDMPSDSVDLIYNFFYISPELLNRVDIC